LLLVASSDRVRVSEAATELGVAVSTAHRLLATLKYRGFVVQAADRSYERGPAFADLGAPMAPGLGLQAAAQPHMEALSTKIDETANLMVRKERDVQVLVSAEASQILRVTSRAGVTLPAHLTSGGRAMLAELPATELEALYPPAGVSDLQLTDADVRNLRRELQATRRRGYGLNRAESERGIAAIGLVIHGSDRRALGALTVSVPTVRFSSARVPELVTAVREARARIEADLAG
jgi:DNA-binding IclR family transcriptional regulator